MIIFLIALLVISAVAFIAFLFSKSKSKRRNLLISGVVAIVSIVAIGVVNAQSGDTTGDSTEPKTEGANTNTNKTDDKDTKKSDNTDNDANSTSPKNDTTNSNEANYRAATYELDKKIATTPSGIGNQTMTIDAYNGLTIGQTTLEQVLATYGVPSYTSGGTEGATVMNIVYTTDQTSYSVDLQFTKNSSDTWLLSSKNSLKTTGVTYPAYTRQ